MKIYEGSAGPPLSKIAEGGFTFYYSGYLATLVSLEGISNLYNAQGLKGLMTLSLIGIIIVHIYV